MKRRILLVDDEVAVLLTLKAVLEISGFDVDTAASAREGKHKLRSNEYQMVISDMRMETDEAGAEVIQAARNAPCHPAVALLTAYPLADEDWQEMGADKMLVKPMHTRLLLEQIESLLAAHERKLAAEASQSNGPVVQKKSTKKAAKKLVRKATRRVGAKGEANSAALRKKTRKVPTTAAKKPASKAAKKPRRR